MNTLRLKIPTMMSAWYHQNAGTVSTWKGARLKCLKSEDKIGLTTSESSKVQAELLQSQAN